MASHRHGPPKPIVPSASSPPTAFRSTTWPGSALSQTEPLNVGSVPTECRPPMPLSSISDSMATSGRCTRTGRVSASSRASSGRPPANGSSRRTCTPMSSPCSGSPRKSGRLSASRAVGHDPGSCADQVVASRPSVQGSRSPASLVPVPGSYAFQAASGEPGACRLVEHLVRARSEAAPALRDSGPPGEAEQGRETVPGVPDGVLPVVSPCSVPWSRAVVSTVKRLPPAGGAESGSPPATPDNLPGSLSVHRSCATAKLRTGCDARRRRAAAPVPSLEEATLKSQLHLQHGFHPGDSPEEAPTLDPTPAQVTAEAGDFNYVRYVYYVL